MTTTPSIATVWSMCRIASTAAWSADSFSPRPTQRPAPIAAASVTRTSSSARFRSGAAPATAGRLHPFGSFHADQIEGPLHDGLRREAEAEPERLRVAAVEHAMLVVEAVEVVGDVDRVVRELVRAAPLGRLGDDGGELDEALDELALLGRQIGGRIGADRSVARVPHDPGDPGRDVLDVVDGVLLRLLGGEVDVDLDRLVVASRDEVPARRVDADLVDELVERHDVTCALRHLGELPGPDQVDELVQEHLDAVGVVAEHAGDGRVPVARAVVVGAEDVD